ncbi:MAG: hypothetical protein Q7R81_04705 [Candidatus Peregrinibacteria bacterium]|nr:hypothetical protein [Candidatus Peregrinibacteria bacterium]
MPIPLPYRTVVILLAGIASVATLLIGFLLFGPVATGAISVAQILPAEGTIALFEHPTAETLEQFSPFTPSLRALRTRTEVPIAIALLDEGNGDVGFAVFSHSATVESITEQTIGPFAVETSSERTMAMVLSAGTRLGRTAEFRALSSAVPTGSSRTFLSLNTLEPMLANAPSDPTVRGIRSLLSRATHVMIANDGNQGSIGAYTGAPANRSAQASNTIAVPAYGELRSAMTFGNLRATYDTTIDSASSEDRLILATLTKTAAAEVIGDEVSFAHDILPLLEEPTQVLIMENPSERRVLLIRGQMSDQELLSVILEKLHRSAAATSTIAFEVRELEDGFRSRTVRSGGGSAERTELNGWDIRRTSTTESGAFITAQRRGEFALSTDPALLSGIIDDRAGMRITLPHLGGKRLFLGGVFLSPAMRQSALSPSYDDTLLSLLLPPAATGSLAIGAERTGAVTTLTWQQDAEISVQREQEP